MRRGADIIQALRLMNPRRFKIAAQLVAFISTASFAVSAAAPANISEPDDSAALTAT
jgi:hypothetical protein